MFVFDKSDGRLHWIEGLFETDMPFTRSWKALSGPYGRGALPNGMYHMTGEEMPWERNEQLAMTDSCEEPNTYKFRLHPQFETPRSGLLLHPDGNGPGTEGCIGATGCTKSLRNFINFYLDYHHGRRGRAADSFLPLWVTD